MLHLQRWLQMAWLTVTLLLLYSNYIHRGPDQFDIAMLLWSGVAVGTLLMFLRSPPGLLVTATFASVVLLAVGPWAIADLAHGIPHGPRHEGNPLVIVEAVLYLSLAVVPAAVVLLLCWLNRRALQSSPTPDPAS